MAAIVVYGAGGLGREVSLLVRAAASAGQGWELLGFVDDGVDAGAGEAMLGLRVLGGADDLEALSLEVPDLAVAVAIGSSAALGAVPAAIAGRGIRVRFPNLTHPDATIDWSHVEAGAGNIVCAGARVNNATFGAHNIINMNTVLGHDCVLGSRNLISPSATLNGQVVVGDDVTIGAGATIMPRVSIGDGATVAIGAVVGKSVAAGETVAGNPARVVARAKTS